MLYLSKFWTVLSHTFITNAKSKTFKISTIITTLLVVALFTLPSFITYFDKEEKTYIGVLDNSNEVMEPLQQQLVTMGYNDIDLTSIDTEELAVSQLNENVLDGYLVIDINKDGSINAAYKAQQISNSSTVRQLELGLSQIQFLVKADTMGLTVEEAAQLFQTVTIEKIALDEGAKSEEEIIQSTVLVYILLFAIYIGVIMYGNLVATEIAKEKSSRVMEILISSVNPIQQMFGKILGIALLGLVQASIFALAGYFAMKFGDQSFSVDNFNLDFSNMPISTIIYAIVFFLLGYILFATLAAMLGSMVSRVEELQQTLTPLNLIVIAAFMIAMYGLDNPNATLIIVTSYIPIFTPMIMFLRVGVSEPAAWEIGLSIGILITTIVAVAILAAKVYKGGVLMYGKGASFKNIKKAITLGRDS